MNHSTWVGWTIHEYLLENYYSQLSPTHSVHPAEETDLIGNACSCETYGEGKPYTFETHAKLYAKKPAQRKRYDEIGYEGYRDKRTDNRYATQAIGIDTLQAVAKLVKYKRQ